MATTVNEDGNSSLLVIDPSNSRRAVTHYLYNLNPLPHGGGTDAITFMDGLMLISASAPSDPTGPAVYATFLRPPAPAGSAGLAMLSPLFYDNSAATPADPGAVSPLALTDPDSNEAVPASAPDSVATSCSTARVTRSRSTYRIRARANQSLSALAISQSVDDTAFATGDGVLFATDPSSDSVDAIHRPVSPRSGLHGRHPLRRQRPGDLPGSRLSGQLPRDPRPDERDGLAAHRVRFGSQPARPAFPGGPWWPREPG